MLRVCSILFMAYMAWVFVQDERALEDLKEFTSKGMEDLLDFNKEWEIGAKALSGKGRFSDKIKEEMQREKTEVKMEA